METVTTPTPQPQESDRANKNLVDGKVLVASDIVFASPGGRGRQGPGVNSVVGPQTLTDWLYEEVSTQTPVSPPSPPLTDSLLPGKQAECPPIPLRNYTFLIHVTYITVVGNFHFSFVITTVGMKNCEFKR